MTAMGSKRRFSFPREDSFCPRCVSSHQPSTERVHIGWVIDLGAGLPEQITAAVVPIYCYQ